MAHATLAHPAVNSGLLATQVTADDISAESQLVKLREKSRTAQKRYRERQRVSHCRW